MWEGPRPERQNARPADQDATAVGLLVVLVGFSGLLAILVDGHPGTAARAALVARLVRVFVPPGPPVTLYFDGHEAAVEQASARVQVIYSGGDGNQRADGAILRHLAHLAAADPDAPVTVVTRDIKLARRARKRGAEVIPPGEFCAAWGLLA